MNTQQSTGGISFAALLGTVFIVLKLCKVITWSWLWVTAPFWIPLAVAGVLLAVAGVLYLIGLIMKLVAKLIK